MIRECVCKSTQQILVLYRVLLNSYTRTCTVYGVRANAMYVLTVDSIVDRDFQCGCLSPARPAPRHPQVPIGLVPACPVLSSLNIHNLYCICHYYCDNSLIRSVI